MTVLMRYAFGNPLVHKIVDNSGVIHETEAGTINTHYPRHTRCEQDWAQLEPVNTVPGDPPTTCISCIVAGPLPDERTRSMIKTFGLIYGRGKPTALEIHEMIGRVARTVK